METKLMEVRYQDEAKGISLTGYADTLITDSQNNRLVGIRLGGYNSYFGKVSFRAYMGDPRHELGPGHIRQAVHLMYAVALSAAALTAWYCWQVA